MGRRKRKRRRRKRRKLRLRIRKLPMLQQRRKRRKRPQLLRKRRMPPLLLLRRRRLRKRKFYPSLLLPHLLPLALKHPIPLSSQARPSLQNPNHQKHLLKERQISRVRKLLLSLSSKRLKVRANLRIKSLLLRLKALVNLLLSLLSLRRSDKKLLCLLKGLVRLWSRSGIPLVPATPQP